MDVAQQPKGSRTVGSLAVPQQEVPHCDAWIIAHVGYFESDLRDKRIPHVTFTKRFDEVDRAIVERGDPAVDQLGFVKVHCAKGSDRILGATIVDDHAGEMLGELTLAMQTKTGLGAVAAVIHPYPTRAEAVRQVGDMANKQRLTPTVKAIFRRLLSVRRRGI